MRWFIAAVLAPALLVAACGGGNNSNDSAPGSGATEDASLPPVRPTPTPVPESFPVLEASAGRSEFKPTAPEFRSLPTADIDARGKKTGVSLATIAERVQANPTSMVTVRGFSPDGRRDMFIRYPLAQVGTNTVLVIDASGALSLFSASIPESEWLIHVQSVSYP